MAARPARSRKVKVPVLGDRVDADVLDAEGEEYRLAALYLGRC
jgi:hypothetical protein